MPQNDRTRVQRLGSPEAAQINRALRKVDHIREILNDLRLYPGVDSDKVDTALSSLRETSNKIEVL